MNYQKKGKRMPRHAADAVKQHNQSVRTTKQTKFAPEITQKGEKGGEDSQAGGWRVQASHQKKPWVNTATTLGL